jgi:hypothetical protein
MVDMLSVDYLSLRTSNHSMPTSPRPKKGVP